MNAKDNILKSVNKKIKRREFRIVIISVVVCLFIGFIIYLGLFVKKTPISADAFKDIHIEIKLSTINEIDNRELPYNHLVFNINQILWYEDKQFYVENNDDNTSTLYFYMSENYIQKIQNKKMEKTFPIEESVTNKILLFPKLCNTDKINEVTKIYYLVYNYKHIDQSDFNQEKQNAILLWEK